MIKCPGLSISDCPGHFWMKGIDGMTAKEYLLEMQFMKIKIEQLQEQKQMYLERAVSITAPINPMKVQSSPTVDRMGDNVVMAVGMDEINDEEIASLWKKQDEVIKQIQGIHNTHYIQLLFKVYVQFKSIRQAAAEMKMSYQYVRNVHKKALAAFEEMYADMLADRRAG